MEFAELIFPRKGQIGYVAAGLWFATNNFAEIVGNDVMETRFFLVFRGGSILEIDAVEKFNELQNANLEPGLFAHFTADGFFEGFANLDSASRNRPFA